MSSPADAEPTSERRLPIDFECPDVLPRHRVRVAYLTYDRDLIRLTYTITPPLPRVDPYAGGAPAILWWSEATDERGARYEDGGGAYGPSPDGERTEGRLTLVPRPPPDARELRVVLHATFPAEGRAAACAFTVDLTAATVDVVPTRRAVVMPRSAGAEPAPARRIPIDVECPDLIAQRRVRVLDLTYHSAEFAMIAYTVTPPLPRGDFRGVERPLITLRAAATDERGTQYQRGGSGGTTRPSPDGERTEGRLSLAPPPPPEARELRVVLHALTLVDGREATCAFTIDLTAAEE